MKTYIAAAVFVLAARSAMALDWPIKGQDSGITKKQTLVIQDAGAWQTLWKSIDKEGKSAPDVDFGAEVVMGEFSGDDSGTYVLNKTAKQTAVQRSPEQTQRLNEFKARVAGLTSSIQASLGAAAADDLSGPVAVHQGNTSRTPASFTALKTNGASSSQVGASDFADQGKPLPGSQEPQQGKPLPGDNRGKPLPGDNNEQGKPLPGADRYHSRPDQYHDRRRPPQDVPYDDTRVDSASYWQAERDFLGYSVVNYGGWQQTTGRASIERGGRETGLSQGTGFQAQLKSTSYRNVYRLYWRYIGRDCDPNDSSRCADWDVQHRWFFEGTDDGQASFMTVNVTFRGDKPLLPWEKENFTISYDGGRVSVNTGDAGYDYSVAGPYIDQQSGTANVTLTPQTKRLNAPEAGKVGLYLVNEGGQLKLVADDARTTFYSGEPLEISVQIKKDSGHWYKKDGIIMERQQNGPFRVVVQGGVIKQTLAVVPTSGSGKYYIKSWSFRRAESKISGAGWIGKGEGNSVQY